MTEAGSFTLAFPVSAFQALGLQVQLVHYAWFYAVFPLEPGASFRLSKHSTNQIHPGHRQPFYVLFPPKQSFSNDELDEIRASGGNSEVGQSQITAQPACPTVQEDSGEFGMTNVSLGPCKPAWESVRKHQLLERSLLVLGQKSVNFRDLWKR